MRTFALLLLALALALSPAAAFAQDEQQPEDQALDLNAEDNVAIAIDWSELTFPDGAAEAVLGRADLFADNLASGSLQGTRPLLLNPSDALDERVLAELQRLAATSVIVLGGPNAVSDDVVAQLEAEGYTVTRRAGVTRTETAIDIADDLTSDTAILARSHAGGDDPTQAFADSIAAGGWAADEGWPVLFTLPDRLTDSTRSHLEEAQYATVYIVGGQQAVSDEVAAEVEATGSEVIRVAGTDRFQTAVAIANERGFNSHADAGLSLLVDGQAENSWADGFSAAAAAAAGPAPIVLANSAQATLPESTAAFLAPGVITRQLADYVLVCGPTTPDEQCEQAATLVGATVVPEPEDEEPPAQEALNLGPDDERTLEPGEARQFTLTAEPDTTYVLALVPASNVDRTTEAATFTDADEDGHADGVGETATEIRQLNGEDVEEPAAQVEGTTDPDGMLTFTIAGESFEEVIPVAFLDADEDGELDVTAEGAQTDEEPFGTGGLTRVLPAEQGGGQLLGDATVQWVDRENSRFVAGDGLFLVTDDDTLRIVAGEAANLPTPQCLNAEDTPIADWLAQLASGDQIDTSSSYSGEGASTLCLEDLVPPTPVASVEEASSTSVTITVANRYEDSTVTVYEDTNDDDALDETDEEVAISETDADEETEGFQIVVSGLTPETDYTFFVTQTFEGERSDPATVEATTSAQEGPIALRSATPEDENNGDFSQTNRLILVFDVPVTVQEVSDITVDGTFVDAAGSAVVGGDGSETVTIELDTTLTDSPQDDNYTVTVAPGAVALADDESRTNTELTAQFQY